MLHRLWREVRHGRCFCSAVAPRALSEMPGPKSLPLLGTLWRYLPLIGEYHFDRLHENGALKLARYGPAVCEELIPGVPIVWLFDPSDIETLFRAGEGRHPRRRSHLALEHFRMGRPHVYRSGGLLPTNGPEWARLRTTLQRSLSRPLNVRAYLPATDTTLRQFLELVKAHNNEKDIPYDFLPQLSRFFLEAIGLVAFDARLGALEKNHLNPESRTARLIDAALTANSCVLRTDNGPQLWRWVRTPLYKRLERALLYLEQVAVELVQNKVARLMSDDNQDKSSSEHPSSLLEQYLASPDLDHKDVVGMAVDMLLAGVDTTTYASSFALYHLATNPDKQRLLRDEARKLLPGSEAATSSTLDRATYTKAVLKESLRLNPVSVGVGRVLENDTVFSGYLVPRGTVVVTQNQVTCRQAQWFRDPDRFVPERWLKGHDLVESPHPFISLPFGHGPRTCIARRLAEQSMQLLLLRIVRDLEISWAGDGNLDCVSLLINKPDRPVRLRFKPI